MHLQDEHLCQEWFWYVDANRMFAQAFLFQHFNRGIPGTILTCQILERYQ